MIRAENVCKYYGDKRAFGPVSFEITDGETVGFLGLNGACKTTALRIFACDLLPSSTLSRTRTKFENLLATFQSIHLWVVEEYLAYAGKLGR